MKELIGKTIMGLRVSGDESVLVFDHLGGIISYMTDSDCCSLTWFADITGVAALIGGMVLEVETMNPPTVDDGRTRQESDIFYGVKLRTNKGYVDIVYRNSSNGYYGGKIQLNTNELPKNLTMISDDWSA